MSGVLFIDRIIRYKILYVTIFVFLNVLIKSACNDDIPQNSKKYCHRQDTCEYNPEEMESRNAEDNALAVMLYDESSILPMHKQERKFKFVEKEIIIKQDWNALGVAAVVWDAAEVLCSYLENSPSTVRNKSVIELGAGTGLVGMVTALLGGSVTITDRIEVLPFLKSTVDNNLPEEIRSNTNITDLDWTIDADKFGAEFDVILGADIVYIEEVSEDLLKTLLKLSSKDTLILLSCRIRYDRDTNFLLKLEEYFDVEKVLYDKTTDVNLYKLAKR